MPTIFKALKPTGFAILIFTLLLIFQAVLFNDSSFTLCSPKECQPGTSTTTYHFEFGIGRPLGLAGDCGRHSISVRWMALLINLMVCYGLAVLSDRGIRKTTRLKRPARDYLTVMVLICLMAFIASVAFSRIYWGYWFKRPSLPPEVSRLARIETLVPVDTKREAGHAPRFIVRNDISFPDLMTWCQAYPHEYPNYRILLYLKKKKLLPAALSGELGDLDELYARLPEKFSAKPKKGYNDSWKLRGLIIDGRDAAGRRLVFVTVMGREVSNDHYPVYDFLFEASEADRTLRFVRGHRFFHDIAGLEGLEWYVMWGIFSFFGILAGLPLYTIGLILCKGLSRPETV